MVAIYLGYQLTVAVPPAEDFTLKMTIEVANPNGSFNAVRPPVNGIGVSGGVWNFHQYDSLGIGKRYPIFVLSNVTPPGYFQTLTKDMFIGLLYANLDCGGA